MAYKGVNEKSFERDLRGFRKEKKLLALVINAIIELRTNPGIGELYSGNLASMRKLVIRYGKNREYRLIYRWYECCALEECHFEEVVEECGGAIQFLFFKSREDCNQLYKRHKKDFEGSEYPIPAK